MKRRFLDLRGPKPLLDIVSYGRAGPRSLTRSEREYVERTVRRAPEVADLSRGFIPTQDSVIRDVAPEQLATIAEPDRTL